MKKTVLAVCLLMCGLPLFAADSQSAESIRYYNSSTGGFGSSAATNYYGLNKTPAAASDDESEVLLDPPAKVSRPARQIKVRDENDEDMEPGQSYADAMDKRIPMTYEQFPKNYDSSNSMMMMQGGMMPGMF